MAIIGNRERIRSSVEDLLLREMVEDDNYEIISDDGSLDNIVDEGERYERGLFDNDLTGDDDFQ